MRGLLRACAVLLAMTGPVVAQDSAAVFRSPILIVDSDVLFRDTAYGQRLQAEIATQTEQLKAENTRIAEALTVEEQQLASRRSTMDPTVFRTEADAFHEKAQGIRRAQLAKETALNDALSQARSDFDTAARPILAQIMVLHESAVIVRRRDVVMFFDTIDITSEAIVAINDALGDGSAVSTPEQGSDN